MARSSGLEGVPLAEIYEKHYKKMETAVLRFVMEVLSVDMADLVTTRALNLTPYFFPIH
jgi:hypothetical protein